MEINWILASDQLAAPLNDDNGDDRELGLQNKRDCVRTSFVGPQLPAGRVARELEASWLDEQAQIISNTKIILICSRIYNNYGVVK